MKLDLEKLSDEELELVAVIPNEVAKEYVVKVWNKYKAQLISEKKNPNQSPDYPGITNLYKYTLTTNRDIQQIMSNKNKFVTIDCIDKICAYSPYNLNEVTDRCIEWAKDNNMEWPKDFINNHSEQRIRINLNLQKRKKK